MQTSDPGIINIPPRRNKAITIGLWRSNKNCVRSRRLETGAIIPAEFVKAPKTRIRTRTAKSKRFANVPDGRALFSIPEIFAGNHRKETDVIVRTRMHTV